MPAPTNPKKRALMPSSPLRKALRAAGHHLSPVVQVGKEGVTPAVIEQLFGALAAHELVKVKIGTESPEDRFEAAERLGHEAGAQLAQILGRTVLVYRRHPEKPRFEPLTPAEKLEAGERAAAARVEARPKRRNVGRRPARTPRTPRTSPRGRRGPAPEVGAADRGPRGGRRGAMGSGGNAALPPGTPHASGRGA